MGAGDGRFLLEAAQCNSERFHVGVEPAADQLAEISGKAARRKLDNLLFVQAAVESLPPELAGAADRVTLNYPWGSLLKVVALPNAGLLAAIAGLGREGAAVTLLVNMSVFEDAAYCAKLGLPCPPVLVDPERTRRLYGEAGLAITRIDPDVADPPYRTTWGQRLTKGTRRRILQLEAVVGGSAVPRQER